MALLSILHYPDPRLHTVAKPVAHVDETIKTLVADMLETMYKAKGIGLAATQVDRHVRVITIDLGDDDDEGHDSKKGAGPLVLINPEIIERDGEQVYEEGCLSVPGIYDKVTRAKHIKVRALGLDGQPFELDADELLSVCIQHEMDHLNGIVFVEHLSRLKQTRIKARISKQTRETA